MNDVDEITPQSEASFVENNDKQGTVELIGDFEDKLEAEPELLSEYESVPAIEAMLLANGEPLSVSKICEVTALSEAKVRDALESIQMAYESEDKGFELVNVGGEYQFRTKQQYARFVQALQETKPRRLSHAAIETLAIIAYRQPVVKSDIEKIRGVDATPTLKTLLDKNLIKIVGHKEAVGQPALYGTGDEFLKLFGLSGLTELPTLREIRELEKDPGEKTLDEHDEEEQGKEGAEECANEEDLNEGNTVSISEESDEQGYQEGETATEDRA